MRKALRILTMATGLLASGCAYVEWPPKGSQSAQPPATPQAESNRMFVGAEAVTVGKGDSVHGLAKRHGVSARAIIDANDLKPPYSLQVGQRLVLPRDREHVVQKGEGLFSVARFYNVDAYEMARLNGIEKPYKLLVGQRLRIPGSGTAMVAEATSSAPPAPAPTAQPAPRVESVSLEPPKDPNVHTAPGGMGIEALPPPKGASAPPPETLQLPPPPSSPAAPPITASVDVGTAPGTAAEPAPQASLPDSTPVVSGASYLWPVKGKVLSGYGPKEKGLQNDGINIAAPEGTPIRAAQDGVVAYVGNELRGFGNLVLVKHGDGHMTAYAHAGEIMVKKGDSVGRGQTIARVGTSGGIKTPQLHFEVRKGKYPVDPMRFLGQA